MFLFIKEKEREIQCEIMFICTVQVVNLKKSIHSSKEDISYCFVVVER